MGYQSESSTFRNAYLMGAQELRKGPPPAPKSVNVRARSMIRAMTIDQLFDTLAVRVMSEQVGGINLCVNWTFTDLANTSDHKWVQGLSNRTMFAHCGRHEATAAASIVTTRATLLEVIAQTTTIPDEMTAGNLSIDGDAGALITIFGNLDKFTPGFAIVEP
jgi:alkyl sulfatase BDS1-like metallo-beta-lactamase superfamily hydrolase